MSEMHNKITLDVIKRNGKKVEFDASKIAIAIKKGFDEIVTTSPENEEESKIKKKKL